MFVCTCNLEKKRERKMQVAGDSFRARTVYYKSVVAVRGEFLYFHNIFKDWFMITTMSAGVKNK